MNNIYETPKSADLQVDDLKNKKPGIILIIFTVLFSVLAYSASFLNQLLATGLIASGGGWWACTNFIRRICCWHFSDRETIQKFQIPLQNIPLVPDHICH